MNLGRGRDVKLKHYYHIYANGLWIEPLNEHFTALNESGLIDELDFIGVGIVGTEFNRDSVKRALPPEFHVVAEAGMGWEQVTHTPLAADLQEPAKILYAHTKGAANSSHSQGSWRREMTEGTVYHWKECVDLLDKYDVVGCRWRRDPWRHFSGTFWWATSSYLSTLAPISYTYRDDAEAWIGYGSVGGTHAEINSEGTYLGVNSFGRTFVAGRTITGQSCSTSYESTIDQPLPGDEYLGFSPIEGTRIVGHLVTNGATCSLLGNTIIVNSVT